MCKILGEKKSNFFFTKIDRFPQKDNFEVFSTFFENFFLTNSEAANIFRVRVRTKGNFFFENPIYIHGDTKIEVWVSKVPKCRDSMNFIYFIINFF